MSHGKKQATYDDCLPMYSRSAVLHSALGLYAADLLSITLYTTISCTQVICIPDCDQSHFHIRRATCLHFASAHGKCIFTTRTRRQLWIRQRVDLSGGHAAFYYILYASREGELPLSFSLTCPTKAVRRQLGSISETLRGNSKCALPKLLIA